MKNKTMKNLIALFSLAVFVFGAKSAFAGDLGFYYGGNSYANTSYIGTNTYNSNSSYSTTQYSEPYTYVEAQPKVQYVYVQQPAQVKYVPVETVKYVSTNGTATNSALSNQGASVVKATNTSTVKKVYTNTGTSNDTGSYVNYDGNQVLANAYNAYNSNGVVSEKVVDSNGVTALTVAGSGSFMPSSVFQWFMVILLILAIIIVARMVSKSFSRNSHTPAH